MDRLEEQLAIERGCQEEGRRRVEANLQRMAEAGRLGKAAPARALLRAAVGALERRLDVEVEALKSGRARRHVLVWQSIEELGSARIAMLAVRSVIDRLGLRAEAPAVDVAAFIGHRLDDERAAELAYRECKPLVQAYLDRMRATGTQHEGHIARGIRTIFERATGAKPPRLSRAEAITLGTALLELIVEETGLVEIFMRARGVKKENVVRLSPAAVEALSKRAEAHASASPVFKPMVVPPLDWTGPNKGGYLLLSASRRARFVKAPLDGLYEELSHDWRPAERLAAALSAIQRTPWAINRWVLEVLKQGWEIGALEDVLPPLEDYQIPEAPSKENEEEFRKWKRMAAEIHTANAKLAGQRITAMRTLAVAEEFAGRRIYFPYSIDFRGRAYPMSTHISPQGSDFERGLLRFADPIPLGERGVYWLAVHGANCYGVDKVPFDERVEWVREHTQQILKCVEDPFGTDFWRQADEPVQFLAFAFEWSGVQKEGADYRSALPVMLDGSCNGLQHFSALLLDEVGGRAVNLLPSDRPADVYAEVASALVARLEQIAALEPEDEDTARRIFWAREWLRIGINRKTTKRVVMTLPYGVSMHSAAGYIEDWAEEAGAGKAFGKDLSKACWFLAQVLWESLGDAMAGAMQCMDWLRACAKAVVEEGYPVSWVTPLGWRVVQWYCKADVRRVKTRLGDRLVYWRNYELNPKRGPDKRKQVSACPPNFVHSLDATAMYMFVEKMRDRGVSAFSLVHDCYGVHAAFTDLARQATREAFVELYTEHDPLVEFAEHLQRTVPALRGKLPAPPEKGRLDIRAVLDSPYFFA